MDTGVNIFSKKTSWSDQTDEIVFSDPITFFAKKSARMLFPVQYKTFQRVVCQKSEETFKKYTSQEIGKSISVF
jgi:hypothetical protein